MCTFIFVVNILAFFCASSFANELCGSYSSFDKESKCYSLQLTDIDAALSSLRFNKSLYTSENKGFIPHYQLHEGGQFPSDGTSAALQVIVPSPSNIELASPGPHADLFNRVAPKEIARLAEILKHLVDEDDSRPAEKLRELFKRWMNQIKGADRKQMRKLWAKSDQEIVDIYVHAFSQAVKEAKQYPLYLMQRAITTMVCLQAKKFNTPYIVSEYLQAIAGHHVTFEKKAFSVEDYFKWSAQYEAQETQKVCELMQNPDELINMTWGCDRYSCGYPPILSTSTSECKADPAKKVGSVLFHNCVEVALLNFFNIICANTMNYTFDIKNITAVFPNIQESLVDFYTCTPKKLGMQDRELNYQDLNDPRVIQEWVNTVSCLNKPDNALPINYVLSSQQYNVFASFDNVLKIFCYLLQDNKLTKLCTHLDGYNRAKAFSYLFNRLSRPDFLLRWSSMLQNKVLGNIFASIDMVVNNKPFLSWHSIEGHQSTMRSRGNFSSDWRKKQASLVALLNIVKDPLLLSMLLPHYVTGNSIRQISKSDLYLKLAPHANSILCSLSLSDCQERLEVLSFYVRAIKDKHANPNRLFMAYLEALIADLYANPLHEYSIEGEEGDGPEIKDPFGDWRFLALHSILFALAQNNNAEAFLGDVRYPLMNQVYKTFVDKLDASLQAEEGFVKNVLLHDYISVDRVGSLTEHIFAGITDKEFALYQKEFAQLICKKNMHAIMPAFLDSLRNSEGDISAIVHEILIGLINSKNASVLSDVLLNECIRDLLVNNQKMVKEVLMCALSKGNVQAVQLLEPYLIDKEGSLVGNKSDRKVLFKTAVLSGNCDALKWLFCLRPQNKWMKDKYLKDKNGNSLLHLVIQKNFTEMFDYLVGDEQCAAQLLRPSYLKNNSGETLLHTAVRYASDVIIHKLETTIGFNRLFTYTKDGFTPLHYTGMFFVSQPVLTVLLEYAVRCGDELIRDRQGNTFLHCLALCGCEEKISMFEKLVNQNEALKALLWRNWKNNKGQSPEDMLDPLYQAGSIMIMKRISPPLTNVVTSFLKSLF